MDNQSLVNDLKDLLNELKEEEVVATRHSNTLHSNGIAQARILLETCLSKHGISKASTLENASEKVINQHEKSSLIGKRFSAQTGHGSVVEGMVVGHNLAYGKVTLLDEDNETWEGYEYQLESIK